MGLFWAGLLAVAIFVGSRNLRHIDAALVGYTFACLFAAFAVAYRYSIWLQAADPHVLAAGVAGVPEARAPVGQPKHLAGRFVRLFLLNEFILRRSRPAGSPTCSSCGGASWPRPSPSRSSTGGCSSRPCPAT